MSGRNGNKDWSASYGDVNWDESGQSDTLYRGFITQAVELALESNAAWYCWHASRRQALLEAIWNEHGAFVHEQIIWAKDRPVLTRSWYMWQHEPCFFGWIKGNKPPRVATDYPATVWTIPTIKPGTKTRHPTSKPVEVFAIPMQQHTREGEICYEPFCGSGSQIVAGEQLGRRVFAIEIEPRYCEVICQRWEALTGRVREVQHG
ncbi:MAG: DNA methyltransferase [bacterium]